MKQTLFISFVLFMAGCCPKIVPETTTTTTRTIDTVWADTAITVPADSAAIQLPIRSLCDSLLKAKTKLTASSPNKRASVSIELVNDTVSIIGDCSQYIHQIRQLQKIIDRQTTTETKIIHLCKSKWHDFLQWYFNISAFFIIIYSLLKFYRK